MTWAIALEALKSVWGWVSKRLPELAIAFAMAVWNWARNVIRREKQLRSVAELETKKLENAIEVDKKYADKSDADIVRDAIDEGRKP